jgi:uncharacterized protein (DUF952 family)/uncharacterized protein YciI
MIALEDWAARDPGAPFATPSLAREGFIHSTEGAQAIVDTGNRHYRHDPRPYVLLTVDLDATGSPWRFDDDNGIYPHIYGSILPAAILREQPFPRAADGTFLVVPASDVPAGVQVETIYVVEATYGPAAARLRPTARPEHLAHIGELLRSGKLIEAGGYLDLTTAVLLVNAASEEEALDVFRDDVYIRTGVWTALRARPFGRVIAE